MLTCAAGSPLKQEHVELTGEKLSKEDLPVPHDEGAIETRFGIAKPAIDC